MTMNLKQIDTAIASIAKRSKTLRADAHTVLVAIIDHYAEHGDYTRLEKLQTVVDQSFGRSALKALNQWCIDYVTSLTWDKESARLVHIKGAKVSIRDVKISANEKKGIEAFEGNARDYSFFNCEVKSDPKPFILATSLATLLKRAEAELEKSHDPVLKAQIEALRNVHLDQVEVEDGEAEVEIETEATRKPARQVAIVKA